jgi:hypothetical protein
MTERPILFSGPMVRAILDGSKTQTRRVAMHTVCGVRLARLSFDPAPDVAACPYGRPGDRLWVREAFALSVHDPEGGDYEEDPDNWDPIYREENERNPGGGWTHDEVIDGVLHSTPIAAPRWRPSIHMPRRFSRIDLEITDVRVERLTEISEADIIAEGCPREYLLGQNWYRPLWDSLNEKRGYGWDVNPWVWVLTFAPVSARNRNATATTHETTKGDQKEPVAQESVLQ